MANKLISQLTSGAANVQDTDVIEGQKSGELITKKFTGAQMRGVEKGEREAQDDQIEASVGLNADGTFTAPANSWYLRSADFTAGITDRAGATGALTENVMNALRILDANIRAQAQGDYVVLHANINSDTTFADLIPAGYMLTYMVCLEKVGATGCKLDLGTTVGGNEVMINQEITASEITTIVIQRVFSLSSATTLYLNDDDSESGWDGSTMDIYFVMTPIIPNSAVSTGVVVVGYYAGNYNLSAPPTEVEIDAIIGIASIFEAGSLFIINDTEPGNESIWFYMTDGINWYYNGSNFDQTP